MTRVVVHRAGLHTTIQDTGRRGFQALGVPPSGPMDQWSHRVSNLMVGNSRTAATLEITATGPDLTFDGEARVAIAGARFSGEGNGRRWTSPVTLDLPATSRLTFNSRQSGMRAYLAVAGGFEAPLVLGSRATDVRSRLGGLKGRPLRDGDVLFVAAGPGAPSTKPRYVTAPPQLVHPLLVEEGANAAPPHRLRIERGPYPTAVADRQFDQLISSTFIVSPQSDRMGYRLSGSPLEGDTVSMISMPTVTGLVQVPPSGEPILLMADRQTTGGYSPVAVVIAADLPLAGQLGPGDTLCFDPCDAAAALQALIAQERALLALERE